MFDILFSTFFLNYIAWKKIVLFSNTISLMVPGSCAIRRLRLINVLWNICILTAVKLFANTAIRLHDGDWRLLLPFNIGFSAGVLKAVRFDRIGFGYRRL